MREEIQNIKKTKIVATISDKQCTEDFIRKLYNSGMDVVRLNSAHQTTADALKVINMVRSVSENIAIMIDTKGPEIRLTAVDPPLAIQPGDEVIIGADDSRAAEGNTLYVNYSGFVQEIKVGTSILIDDGNIELEVIRKTSDKLICRTCNGGVVKSRKSVNVPNVQFDLPGISLKDKEFIRFAAEQKIDFIAHSFVRNKEDMLEVQAELNKYHSNIGIIAKIENQQGVDHLNEILHYAYGVMVARGDLAVEIPFEKIPGVQRDIIKACNKKRKPVIVATQMLHSMIEQPRPTRAEVNDVASAIFRRTDAVMLSGETANGKYPLEAVQTMAKIAIEVEKSKEDNLNLQLFEKKRKIPTHLARYAVEAATDLNASAIIADTNTGRTPRSLSAYHGRKPVFAICYAQDTMRKLALSYGVVPLYMAPKNSTHEFLSDALIMIKDQFQLDNEELMVVIAGNLGLANGASFVEIGTVENLISS